MIKKKHGKWGYDLRLRDPVTGKKTRRVRYFECETRDEAEELVAAILITERNKKYGIEAPSKGPSLLSLIEKRLPDIRNSQERARADRVLKTWLGLLLEGHPIGQTAISQTETPHLKLYVTHCEGEGKSASTIDRELNIIAATLNSAREYFPEVRGWLPPKIPRPKLSKNRRERLITDDEYRRILDYLQRPRAAKERQLAYQARIRAAHLLRFALLTGMRPKEIFRLHYFDIDWDGNRIRVRGTKTENRGNSTRYVPLSPSIIEILQARKVVGESLEYIFSISGSPRYTDYDLLKEACEKNRISYGRSVENGFELYCARHTFTTKLLLAGMSLAEIGAITGHSDRELVLYYSHVVPETNARAMEKIEEIEARRLGRAIEPESDWVN